MKKMILSALLLFSISAQSANMKDLDMVCTNKEDARDRTHINITNNVLTIYTQIDGQYCNPSSLHLNSENFEAFTDNKAARVKFDLNCYALQLANVPTNLITSEDVIYLVTNNSEVMEYNCERKSYYERLKESLTPTLIRFP